MKRPFALTWEITLRSDPSKILTEGRNLYARDLEEAKDIGRYHATRMRAADGYCATSRLIAVKALTEAPKQFSVS